MRIGPVREARIGGHPVWVFDGLLGSVGAMVEALDRAPFTRTEVATPETAQYRHWASEMSLAALSRLPLNDATQQALASVLPGRRFRAYRAYTNFSSYGDVLPTHTDCAPDAEEYTALWFLANQWDPEWGGETLFFDGTGDARFVVSPRPGRLVLFHGAIRHAGRPPQRHCHVARYTFAIKLEPADAIA